jgi:hypothetical protein
MVIKQMQVGSQDNSFISASIGSAVSSALQKQSAALEKERDRIRQQDQAEQKRRDDREKEDQRRQGEAKRIKDERERLAEWERLVAFPWDKQVLRLVAAVGSEQRWLVPGEESTKLMASGELASVADSSLPVRCSRATDVGKGWYRLRAEKFSKGVFDGKAGEFLLGLEAEGDNHLLDAGKSEESQALLVRFLPTAAPETAEAADTAADDFAAKTPEPASGAFFVQLKASELPSEQPHYMGLLAGEEADSPPRVAAVTFSQASLFSIVLLAKDDCSESYDELKEKITA